LLGNSTHDGLKGRENQRWEKPFGSQNHCWETHRGKSLREDQGLRVEKKGRNKKKLRNH
jgi:hypothetical protein